MYIRTYKNVIINTRYVAYMGIVPVELFPGKWKPETIFKIEVKMLDGVRCDINHYRKREEVEEEMEALIDAMRTESDGLYELISLPSGVNDLAEIIEEENYERSKSI